MKGKPMKKMGGAYFFNIGQLERACIKKELFSDLISLNAFLHMSLYYHQITRLGNKENAFYFIDHYNVKTSRGK